MILLALTASAGPLLLQAGSEPREPLRYAWKPGVYEVERVADAMSDTDKLVVRLDQPTISGSSTSSSHVTLRGWKGPIAGVVVTLDVDQTTRLR